MQKQQKKALIIGCGIAGPALALFLKRVGIQAEIYEARETAEGFALSLSGNGVAVLQELGLDGAAFAHLNGLREAEIKLVEPVAINGVRRHHVHRLVTAARDRSS